MHSFSEEPDYVALAEHSHRAPKSTLCMQGEPMGRNAALEALRRFYNTFMHTVIVGKVANDDW
jgi:hypothetical protein